MKPRPAKDSDINIYEKFNGRQEGGEGDHRSQAHPQSNEQCHANCVKSGKSQCTCGYPRGQDIQTFQELTETIQLMQNRLKYIESAKHRNERQLDTTMKKTNNFVYVRAMAEELNKKVNESKKREESLRTALRNKAAELNMNHKKAIQEKTAKLRDEKIRQTELARQEKQELERRARQAQEEDLLAKKSKVLKVKNEKLNVSIRDSNTEKLSRRGSMFNLDMNGLIKDRENRRRMNLSIHENRMPQSGQTLPARNHFLGPQPN